MHERANGFFRERATADLVSTSCAGMIRIRFEGLRVCPALSALQRSPVVGMELWGWIGPGSPVNTGRFSLYAQERTPAGRRESSR